jgi:N-succinyldiaminopimelate aminotransferase
MPRFPHIASRTADVTASVFEQFRSRTRADGDLVKLHIGDSYARPAYALPLDGSFVDAHPEFNRYTDTFGVPELREALSRKLREENAIDANPGEIMMTAGACNALAISMQGLVDPGEDVLLLTPCWPFFRGMVKLAGGRPIDVPFYTRLYDDPGTDIAGLLRDHSTASTVALYLNTPNNPSGKVLSRRQLEQVADFVRTNDLWLISDEAYDGMTFDGHTHLSIGSFDGMFDRTLSVFTFSKVYMFSGLRLGYVVAVRGVLEAINKIMVHQLYSPATVSQQMMVEPVKTRSQWAAGFVEEVRCTRDMFVERLRIAPRVPEGAYYFFFSIAEYLAGRSYRDVINACLDAGVTVAPGADFGEDYGEWIRICFAGEPPERIRIAAERLNTIFPQ